MKRVAAFLSIVAMAVIGSKQPVFSQTAKEIFNSTETPVTYLGIDFTQARLINDAGASGTDLKEKHFPGINQVLLMKQKNMTWQRLSRKADHERYFCYGKS